MIEYCPCPAANLRTSFVSTKFRKSAAPAAVTRTSPICEISKTPAARRTARCSSTMLEYCTGISQPPNSTIRPPNFKCASYSGVRFNIRAAPTYQLPRHRQRSALLSLTPLLRQHFQVAAVPQRRKTDLTLHFIFAEGRRAQNGFQLTLRQIE